MLYKQDNRDGYNVRKCCSVLTQGLINVRRHLDSAQLLIMILAHKLRTYVRMHKARAVSLVFLESRPQITILQGRPPATRVTRQSL